MQLSALVATYAPSSLSDPAGSSVLVAAVLWLEGTVLGTIATTIAIIAIAWVGLMMLLGRADIRYGLTVILGCFILFGAPTIAVGIRDFLAGGEQALASPLPSERPPPELPSPPPPAHNDPYAGASLPAR
jgi:type IV secretory pathway VirB2 component (pilin)